MRGPILSLTYRKHIAKIATVAAFATAHYPILPDAAVGDRVLIRHSRRSADLKSLARLPIEIICSAPARLAGAISERSSCTLVPFRTTLSAQ